MLMVTFENSGNHSTTNECTKNPAKGGALKK